jgi:hypothetical protein
MPTYAVGVNSVLGGRFFHWQSDDKRRDFVESGGLMSYGPDLLFRSQERRNDGDI